MPRPVIDCHSDVMLDVYRRRAAGERAVLTRVHLPAYREGGVVAAVCTVGGDVESQFPLGMEQPYRSVLLTLEALHADVAESEGRFAIVGSAAEVEACIDEGIFAIVPALEGAMAFEGDLTKVEDLYERGVRVVGLTWNSRNELAVGNAMGEGGLTELGERAIALMNDLGVLIDLSHASATTFWDAARITRAPLYASHSNARAVWDTPRNLDDDQLAAIAASDGAVGLVFCPNFVAANPVTLDDVLTQFDYLVGKAGVEAVVIGADFVDYFVEEMKVEIERHPDLCDEGSLRYPEGIETVTSMQNLIAAIEARVFDDDALEKIASGNFLRLLETTQALAAVSAGSER